MGVMSMYSPNIKTIPLNPVGALELDLCPCDYCNLGWGIWSTKEVTTCRDACPYWGEYCRKKHKR